ncbi:hypothetical protein ATPR_0891 [Acetobacter tropicalis NBRC 101654]|uniref:Uncharacterized protein n=1 Tax=Acetobacter tropicalis NBRC 101654 TaxID=749388 RepID=F7VBZ2_9PROT|nr:hypothetical protein ATPR_0891 [Acetobacter tropicalis NBRC 101654]
MWQTVSVIGAGQSIWKSLHTVHLGLNQRNVLCARSLVCRTEALRFIRMHNREAGKLSA